MQFSLDFHNLHEMPTKHIALWRHRKKKKKKNFSLLTSSLLPAYLWEMSTCSLEPFQEGCVWPEVLCWLSLSPVDTAFWPCSIALLLLVLFLLLMPAPCKYLGLQIYALFSNENLQLRMGLCLHGSPTGTRASNRWYTREYLRNILSGRFQF